MSNLLELIVRDAIYFSKDAKGFIVNVNEKTLEKLNKQLEEYYEWNDNLIISNVKDYSFDWKVNNDFVDNFYHIIKIEDDE